MGTWCMPEDNEDRDLVNKILSKSLPCGKGGQNAMNVIANLIGDDRLCDDIIDLAARNPRYTANFLILEKLREWHMMDKHGNWIDGEWDGNTWRPNS